jgi:hypothetical protein
MSFLIKKTIWKVRLPSVISFPSEKVSILHTDHFRWFHELPSENNTCKGLFNYSVKHIFIWDLLFIRPFDSTTEDRHLVYIWIYVQKDMTPLEKWCSTPCHTSALVKVTNNVHIC